MNTTREQRAEAYRNKFARSDGFSPRHLEKAHIAGATEEAAIKDAVIKQRDDVILELFQALEDFELESQHTDKCRWDGTSESIACKCMDRNFFNKIACLERASLTLKKHSALIEELAKGKV